MIGDGAAFGQIVSELSDERPNGSVRKTEEFSACGWAELILIIYCLETGYNAFIMLVLLKIKEKIYLFLRPPILSTLT